jgi:hypothetical protein
MREKNLAQLLRRRRQPFCRLQVAVIDRHAEIVEIDKRDFDVPLVPRASGHADEPLVQRIAPGATGKGKDA